MRMRKLGHGQSILFCGPPEIHQKILQLSEKGSDDSVEVRDVLLWSISETCINARKLLPIWAKQGIGYQKRLEAWGNIEELETFPPNLLEKEAKTLEEHYGYSSESGGLDTLLETSKTRHRELLEIQEKCRMFRVESLEKAHMLEEQERELSHEVERERENQRPPKATPLNHQLSENVRRFIMAGTLPPNSSDCFVPAFNTLSDTSAAKASEPGAWSTNLLTTLDFSRVIDRRQNDKMDEFLRPVNWIVSSVNRSVMVIMSPYEINQLIPQIRRSSSVFLHMYSPKTMQATESYEKLTFCSIPAVPSSWNPDLSLVDQLNIFAGQLFFQDHDTYERVCSFLSLYLKEMPRGSTICVRSDGFVEGKDRQALGMGLGSPFSMGPVPFLRSLVGFRRKGQSYIATHMGQILHARVLSDTDFEPAAGAKN